MEMGSTPHIRLAARRELDDIGALVRDAFAPFRLALPPHIFERYVAEASDLSRTWPDATIAVIDSSGRIAGTVTYYDDAAREGMGWPSGPAGLRTLAVSPSAQGRGYGRLLCDWCVARARRQRAEGIALHTAAFMTSACTLYESMGFERRPSHDLLASDVLGFDPATGDQEIMAYLLPLMRA